MNTKDQAGKKKYDKTDKEIEIIVTKYSINLLLHSWLISIPIFNISALMKIYDRTIWIWEIIDIKIKINDSK